MDIVLESRSNPWRIAEVKRAFDAMHPQLFRSLLTIDLERYRPGMSATERMRLHDANKKAYERGLGMVLTATGRAREDLPALSGPSSLSWGRVQEKMHAYEQQTGVRFIS